MNYKSILEGHDCKCLKNANDNFTDLFARKVGDTKGFKLRDFKTHHERGKILDDASCEDTCGFRGVSIELWNDTSKEYLMQKYGATSGIAPMFKIKSQIGVFRIAKGAGQVKHTPNQKTGLEIYHYDFYKSDNFTIQDLVQIDLIPIL